MDIGDCIVSKASVKPTDLFLGKCQLKQVYLFNF